MTHKKKQNQPESPETGEINISEEPRQDLKEWKDKYLRALADYQNLEQRTRQERAMMREYTTKEIISHFLPIVDMIEQAEVFNSDPGLKMVSDSFKRTLKELGLQELDLQGKEFDPHTAEVAEVLEGEAENCIVQVVQKGYMLNGQLIRHARVKVGKLQKSM